MLSAVDPDPIVCWPFVSMFPHEAALRGLVYFCRALLTKRIYITGNLGEILTSTLFGLCSRAPRTCTIPERSEFAPMREQRL
jgi:hypothetical protein